MILTQSAPAATTPVSLSEFSAHLRLANGFPDDGAEDALLQLYLDNAVAAVEARTGLALIRRGFVLRMAGWDRAGHAVLPVGPVAAIGTLRFVQGTAAIDVDPASWALEPGTARQRVTGPNGEYLPSIPDGYVAEFTFDAGFGSAATDVPGDLRQAVTLLAADFYERRFDDAGPGIPMAVRGLLVPWLPVRI